MNIYIFCFLFYSIHSEQGDNASLTQGATWNEREYNEFRRDQKNNRKHQTKNKLYSFSKYRGGT